MDVKSQIQRLAVDEVMAAWDAMDAAAQRVQTAQASLMTEACDRLEGARLRMRSAIQVALYVNEVATPPAPTRRAAMAEKMTKAMRDRFEFGEVERDIARERLMLPPGGVFDRMLAWLQKQARAGREDAHEQVIKQHNAEASHDR